MTIEITSEYVFRMIAVGENLADAGLILIPESVALQTFKLIDQATHELLFEGLTLDEADYNILVRLASCTTAEYFEAMARKRERAARRNSRIAPPAPQGEKVYKSQTIKFVDAA